MQHHPHKSNCKSNLCSNRGQLTFWINLFHLRAVGQHIFLSERLRQTQDTHDYAIRYTQDRDQYKRKNDAAAAFAQQGNAHCCSGFIPHRQDVLGAGDGYQSAEVGQVDGQNQQGSDGQSHWHRPFGIFHFMRDVCRDSPAVVGESHRCQCSKPTPTDIRDRNSQFRRNDRSRLFPENTYKGDGDQRNQFHDGGEILEVATQSEREIVQQEEERHIACSDQCLCFQCVRQTQQHAGVDAGYPAHDDGDRWQVNEQLEPAERACCFIGDELLEISDDAAGFFGPVSQLRQGDAPKNDAECTDTENQNP